MEKRYSPLPYKTSATASSKRSRFALTAFPKRLEDVSNVGLFYVLMAFLGFLAGGAAMVVLLR